MAQQQWASQYDFWNFNNNLDVRNIDQQVWLPQPNTSSYWALQWSWKGANGVGGYMGLQQGGDGAQQVRFSLWNAIACRNGSCTPFGGEGVGYTCVLPITINTGKFYRYRLWRQEADSDGIWWGAWLIEEDNGILIEHSIGGIKVPLSYNIVDPSSIQNFVEYFGSEMDCKEVPLSIVGYTPPAVNYHGKGTGVYDGYSTYFGSNRADGNTCGTEKQKYGTGALVTAQPFNFGFANGVVMFLGGDNPVPKLNPITHRTPPGMPNS